MGLSGLRGGGNGTGAAKHKVTYDSGGKSRMKLSRQLKHLTRTSKAKGSLASQARQVVFGGAFG